MSIVETKICFDNVVLGNGACENVVAVIMSSSAFTIDEMQIIVRYGLDLIKNPNKCKEKMSEKLKYMTSPTATAIAYSGAIRKLISISYEVT